MPIPTEPIGSIPRTTTLVQALERWGDDHPSFRTLCEATSRETAFATIEAGVRGTALAAVALGVAR